MSTALDSFKRKEIKSVHNAPAYSIGAKIAYNETVFSVLPPIVAELEKKIADLQEKVDKMKRPAGTGLSAVRGLHGGRYTRRNRHSI
jgi:hypothetical protein